MAPEAPTGKVIDLMEALKASLGMTREDRKPAIAAAAPPAAAEPEVAEAPKKKAKKK
jgi:non-homologous end joining protein Ku